MEKFLDDEREQDMMKTFAGLPIALKLSLHIHLLVLMKR
jgi:hypothetical protein